MKAEKREVWKKKSLNDDISASQKTKTKICEVKKKNDYLVEVKQKET